MKLVVGNQKSYLNSDEINHFIEGLTNISNPNVIICPSSIYFDRFKNTNIILGSQNVSSYPSGATTGELSAEQLKSLGVQFALVGHSERRQVMGESIKDTNIKIKRLLDNRIVPILCVGETKEERDNDKTKEIILDEIIGAFEGFSTDFIEKIVIAYEPIWSIGTGNIPNNDEIEEVAKYLRDVIRDRYNTSNIILYGGSVNKDNIDYLNKINMIDGYLIGGASTKIDGFLDIINKC